MPNKPTCRDAILAHLREHGPMTFSELAQALAMHRNRVADAIGFSRRNHGPAHFRIQSWAQSPRSGTVPVWAAGPGKDAPRPPPPTKIERRRIWRDRNRARSRVIDRLSQARRRGTTPTPAGWVDVLKVAA